MKEDKAKQYSSLRDLLEGEKKDILHQCNLCGECLETCPVYPLTSFSNESPAEIQQKVLDALDGKPSEIARELAYSCVRCVTCSDSCPQGLNPYHLQEILKTELVSCGSELPLARPQIGDRVYDIQEALGYLQIKPSQVRWLTEVPAQPKPEDIVVFLGCGNRVMPDKSLALLDLLEMMGIDFVALGGGNLCCGSARFLARGDLTTADRLAGEWVTALNAFQPKKVACTCGSCCYQAGKVFPGFADVGFQPIHVSKLLADEIHRLKFSKPIEAKITVHDPCYMSRKIGDVNSVRKLLGAVPGVTLVEMAHNKENALCCGLGAQGSYPNIAKEFRRQVLDEAKETGAQILATTCIGCHSIFSRYERDYPFEVKHFINLVAEAAGLSYEDKLKKYLNLGTIEAIIDECKEYIEASPYTLEEYKQLLPLVFNFPGP